MGAYEAKGHLSQQERNLLEEEVEINALYNTPKTIEQLREKGGPAIIAEKYEHLFVPFLAEQGLASRLSLEQCYTFGKANHLPFEPIVLLASAMEAEKNIRRKSTLH